MLYVFTVDFLCQGLDKTIRRKMIRCVIVFPCEARGVECVARCVAGLTLHPATPPVRFTWKYCKVFV